MNRSVRLLLVVAPLVISGAAFADDLTYACEQIRPDEPYTGTIPKPFTMVPLCHDAAPAGRYRSHYSFVGDATVSGTAVYKDTDTGPSAYFDADEMSKARLPTIPRFGATFGLSDEDANKFHMPLLMGESDCREAPATIRIKRIYVALEDSCFQGAYLPSYTVIRVGEYRICKAKTEIPPELKTHKKARKADSPEQ